MTSRSAAALLLGLCLVTSLRAEEPLRVGGNIKEPRKTKHANPHFPTGARDAGRQDFVFLTATIDEKGNVAAIAPLRGTPEFVEAASDAVRQWRYTPVLLNGKPVAIRMTVTMAFFLSGFRQTPIIAEALADPREEVRLKAVAYLSGNKLNPEAVRSLLEGVVNDGSEAVREAVQRAIADLEGKQ